MCILFKQIVSCIIASFCSVLLQFTQSFSTIFVYLIFYQYLVMFISILKFDIITVLFNYLLIVAVLDARSLADEVDISHYTSACEIDASDVSEENNDDFRIVSPLEWKAKPNNAPLAALHISPVPYVIISHTATKSCSTPTTCQCLLRSIQSYHMDSRKWNDIGYNFIIGGDNLVYVGRGWDMAGAHAYGYNFNSIGITFIGTFNTIAPSDKQIQAAQKLIEIGIEENKIAEDYKLLGHRQINGATDSPGHVLYQIIQNWTHWAAEP